MHLESPALADLGEVARTGWCNHNLGGSFALRIRFSAARYSFCSRSSWLTEPVTQAWFQFFDHTTFRAYPRVQAGFAIA